MHFKSILLAFVASALVAAAPTPEDAHAVTSQAVPLSEDNTLGLDDAATAPDTLAAAPDLVTPFDTSLLVDISLLVAPTGNTGGVLFPEYQSTNPGHTWPLVQCDGDKKLLKGFFCTPGLLTPYGSNASIYTWDTDKIRIGNRCHNDDNKKLPPTWVCMRPDGSNNLKAKKSHLRRGFWKKMDCSKHDHLSCSFRGGRAMEVVDENGREWDKTFTGGEQGW